MGIEGDVPQLRRKIELRTGFWWGNLKERCHIEDLGVDGRTILK
jgi:hypothetical protein